MSERDLSSATFAGAPSMKYGDLISAAGKLAPDEPWFLIRAQDLTGPNGVAAYAAIRRRIGDEEGAAHVEAVAVAMLRWQADNRDRVKLPD